MKEFERLLIGENSSLLNAMVKLEETKKKVLFVISDGKLVAALSDGDIRRWIINEGRLDAKVKEFAYYNPVYVYEDKRDEVYQVMKSTYSEVIPIVNSKMEVIDIVVSASIASEIEKIDSNISVVMNAGGKGTRLYPYTKILPKPLIPIGEIPISEHIINHFFDIGCKDFYMIINEKRDMIKAYFFNQKHDWKLTFAEETIPLGTGGGLSLLQNKIKNTFIFVNCDTILLTDFAAILRKHKENGNLITIICAKMKYKIPYGIVKSNEDIFLEIKEKPQMNFQTNVGCYIVEPELLSILPKNKKFDFPDIVVYCKENGFSIGVFPIEAEEWLDMGQFQTLEDMKKRLRVE